MTQPPSGPASAAPEAPTPTSAADWGMQAAAALLSRMLDSADDTLFELSGRTQSDEQRKGYFDVMRLLRKSGRDLAQRYDAALRATGQPQATGPVEFSLETLSLRGDSEVESEILMSRTVGRVEGAAQQLLWELGLRLEQLSSQPPRRKVLEQLRPAGLTAAFRKALDPLKLPPDIQLILFKLFEGQLLADARAYYEGLNTQLEAEGVTSKAVPVRRRPAAAAAALAGGAAGAPPEPTYSLPSSLVGSLSQWGIPASAWGGGAAGPGGMAGGAGVGAGGGGGAVASAGAAPFGGGAPQRLSLVNQLLEETGNRWPGEELDALRRLILPIVQIALSDASFFTNREHPARQLIGGLETLASEPVDQRSARLAETESALRALQQQHQAAPSTVAPLSAQELQGFLVSQRAPHSNTLARMAAARASVHEQIKTVGSGYELPLGLVPFLNEVWMPMVSALSLKFGVGSPEWKRAMEVLQRLFGESRWITGDGHGGLVDTILTDMGGEMSRMGMPANLVERASTLLRTGLSSSEQSEQCLDLETFSARRRAPVSKVVAREDAAAPIAPAHNKTFDWRAALPVGAWYRVFDRKADRTAWMTADVFYPEAAALAFTGFDPGVKLTISKTDFLADLRSGKAEAVSPTPAQAEAIARLTAAAAPSA